MSPTDIPVKYVDIEERKKWNICVTESEYIKPTLTGCRTGYFKLGFGEGNIKINYIQCKVNAETDVVTRPKSLNLLGF